MSKLTVVQIAPWVHTRGGTVNVADAKLRYG